MEYLIAIFMLGLIVTFIVVVGLARAAEFAHAESAGHLEIDALPEDLKREPKVSAARYEMDGPFAGEAARQNSRLGLGR
jgi:hypothetical protein